MTSPREEGIDSSGIPRRLGEQDDYGVVIGFIEEDGTCWESCLERDIATTGARFDEALWGWVRSAGITEQPDPHEFAEKYCRDRESIESAVSECKRQLDPNDPLTRIRLRVIRKYIAEKAKDN
jgi:hypothetical protein